MEALLYLGIMLAVIIVWFMVLKRPIYEAVALSFIVLVAVTGTWSNIFTYISDGMGTSLLYCMVAFVAMSQVLTKTKVIDKCVMMILALLGRIPGGAGYASVVASSFMGALSGSGPGNIMATGVITIPSMKKTGFPDYLAANIVSSSSYLGNMIPPSANIVAALGALTAYHASIGFTGEPITQGQFWIVCWGLSLWFILARLIQVFAFCKYYKVKAVPKEERPRFRDALKMGWVGLLLPVVILLPFILDALFNATFFTERLGVAGAKQFSSSLLIFMGGVAAIYGLLIAENKKELKPKNLIETFAKGVKSLVPTVATCIFGYMIGELFASLEITDGLKDLIAGLNLGHVGLALFIPLIACFISMIIPGSAAVVIFGELFIGCFAAVGVNPVLIAGMLPCICGVMCGITPPFALGMYAGMSIAESEFSATFKNNLWWIAAQYLLEVVILLGFLPILGL